MQIPSEGVDRPRPTFDAVAEYHRLSRALREREARVLDSGLQRHFDAVAERRHLGGGDRPVLALSVGGSTTKLMIGRAVANQIVPEHVRVAPNPPEPIPVDAYLDGWLMSDPVVRGYLAEPDAAIAVSVPVLVIDGVPYHPSKVETIDGLVCRNEPVDTSRFHLGRNLAAFLAGSGLPAASVCYQSDGVLAHLGGVASDRQAGAAPTMLLVCGTGMATAIDAQFVLVGMAEVLHEFDAVLYPPAETEQGQYQYLIAGKGLYGTYRRRVEQQGGLRATVPGDIAACFASAADSRRVIDLWQNGAAAALPADVASRLSQADCSRLGALAAETMEHGAAALACCIAATLDAASDAADRRTPHRVYLEGSIARHAGVRAGIDRWLDHLLSGKAADGPARPLLVPDEDLELPANTDVDLSLVGTAALAMAHRVIR